MILGFGAAHATKKEGAVGDTARAVGDIALSAREKAREINQRHNVVERSSTAAQDAWQKAQDMDQEHHYLERGRNCAVKMWTALVDFVQRHNLIERGVNTIGRTVVWAAESIGRKIQEHQEKQQLDPVPQQPAFDAVTH